MEYYVCEVQTVDEDGFVYYDCEVKIRGEPDVLDVANKSLIVEQNLGGRVRDPFHGQEVQDDDKVGEQLETIRREEIAKCDLVKDFDGRLACKSTFLYKVSEMQDLVNLNVMGDFSKTDPQCSKDVRWEAVHLLDNANAVFLGVARDRYNPDVFWSDGSYVESKANKMCGRVSTIAWEQSLPDELKRKVRTEEEKAESRREMDKKYGPGWRER